MLHGKTLTHAWCYAFQEHHLRDGLCDVSDMFFRVRPTPRIPMSVCSGSVDKVSIWLWKSDHVAREHCARHMVHIREKSIENWDSWRKKTWAARFICVSWHVWKQRNVVVFGDRLMQPIMLAERIKTEATLWSRFSKANYCCRVDICQGFLSLKLTATVKI